MWLRVAAGRLRGRASSSLASLRASNSFLPTASQKINNVFGRRSLSLLSDDAARNEQMLASLAEYKAGQQYENIGEYNKACHEYTRVHDIISSAMGKSSPIAFQGILIQYLLINCSLIYLLNIQWYRSAVICCIYRGNLIK